MTSYCLVLSELIHSCLVLKHLYAKMNIFLCYMSEPRMKTTTNILNKFLFVPSGISTWYVSNHWFIPLAETIDRKQIFVGWSSTNINFKNISMSHRRHVACKRFFVLLFVSSKTSPLLVPAQWQAQAWNVSCNRMEQYRLVWIFHVFTAVLNVLCKTTLFHSSLLFNVSWKVCVSRMDNDA